MVDNGLGNLDDGRYWDHRLCFGDDLAGIVDKFTTEGMSLGASLNQAYEFSKVTLAPIR